MTSVTTKPDSSQRCGERAVYFSTTGLIRSKVACAIGFAEPSMP